MAPHIFSNDLNLHLVHLQSLPGRFSGTGQVGNTRNIGSPYTYMDKGRLLQKSLCEKPAQSEQKPAKNKDRVAKRTLSF